MYNLKAYNYRTAAWIAKDDTKPTANKRIKAEIIIYLIRREIHLY